MNEKIKALTKNPKLLVIIGLVGIVLIFLSSIFSDNDNKEEKSSDAKVSYTAQQYCEEIENDIKAVVSGITGDDNPTVVITLESGIRYSYASADETDMSSSKGDTNDQNSESKKQSYITVKNSDGSEKALIVTEAMPEIRGVAIICKGGNNQATTEKVTNAVTSALNITSKRVYVSGGAVK